MLTLTRWLSRTRGAVWSVDGSDKLVVTHVSDAVPRVICSAASRAGDFRSSVSTNTTISRHLTGFLSARKQLGCDSLLLIESPRKGVEVATRLAVFDV